MASVIVSIVLSAVAALFMCLAPSATSTSSSLDAVPLVIQIFGSNNVVLNGFGFDHLAYELYSLFDVSQGLTSNPGGAHGLFNPGADIDLTTTTDFEDLAAPVADVMEFTDQDRALAADSIVSTFLWHGAAGFVFGAALRLILSAELWRDIL